MIETYSSQYAAVPYNFSYRCQSDEVWRHGLQWLGDEVKAIKTEDLSRLVSSYYDVYDTAEPAKAFVDALTPFQLLSKVLASFMAFRVRAHQGVKDTGDVAIYPGSWFGQLPLIDKNKYHGRVLIDKDEAALRVSRTVLDRTPVRGDTEYQCVDLKDWSFYREKYNWPVETTYHVVVTGAEHFDNTVLTDKFKQMPVGTTFTILSTNAEADGHIAKCESSYHLREQFEHPWCPVHEEAVLTVPWASRFGISMVRV